MLWDHQSCAGIKALQQCGSTLHIDELLKILKKYVEILNKHC